MFIPSNGALLHLLMFGPPFFGKDGPVNVATLQGHVLEGMQIDCRHGAAIVEQLDEIHALGFAYGFAFQGFPSCLAEFLALACDGRFLADGAKDRDELAPCFLIDFRCHLVPHFAQFPPCLDSSIGRAVDS